jgi:hypothetical protein
MDHLQSTVARVEEPEPRGRKHELIADEERKRGGSEPLARTRILNDKWKDFNMETKAAGVNWATNVDQKTEKKGESSKMAERRNPRRNPFSKPSNQTGESSSKAQQQEPTPAPSSQRGESSQMSERRESTPEPCSYREDRSITAEQRKLLVEALDTKGKRKAAFQRPNKFSIGRVMWDIAERTLMKLVDDRSLEYPQSLNGELAKAYVPRVQAAYNIFGVLNRVLGGKANEVVSWRLASRRENAKLQELGSVEVEKSHEHLATECPKILEVGEPQEQLPMGDAVSQEHLYFTDMLNEELDPNK